MEVLDSLESSSDTVVYALDETSVGVESDNRCSWSPVGAPPVLEKNGSHEGINMSANSYPIPDVRQIPLSATIFAEGQYNTSWEYVGYWYGETEDRISAVDNAFTNTYPTATRVSTYSIKYNCHSYAWYSASPSNLYWIQNPMPFMDPSVGYRKVPCAVGTKVFYDFPAQVPGEKDHSGIVYSFSIGPGGRVTVISKWSWYGLYIHELSDNPYSYGTEKTFWTR